MHNLFLQRGIKYLLCRVLTQGIILTVFTAMLDRWIISKLDATQLMKWSLSILLLLLHNTKINIFIRILIFFIHI